MAKPDGDLAKRDKKRAVALAHLSGVPANTPGTPRERGYDACPCSKDCALHGECRLCTA